MPRIRTDPSMALVYAPLAEARTIGAIQFDINGGSARNIITTSRIPVILFDQTTAESALGFVRLPAGWSAFTATLLWTNAGAGSGNVAWQLTSKQVAVGASMAAATAHTQVIDSAPTQDVLKETVLVSAVSLSTSHDVGLRLIRQAADDTLANDASLVAVRFDPSS
jgi:hypothetical protein